MFNITIGFTEPEPDSNFIQLVQHIVEADQSLVKETSLSKEYQGDVEIVHLTNKNSEDFSRKIKAGLLIHEPAQADQTFNALGFYEEESGHTGLIIFDISKISKNIRLFIPLFSAMENSDCGILFLNPKSQEFNNIILKYDGTDTSMFSILSFSRLFPVKAKHAESSTIISPVAFKKSQVAVEKQFVKKISAFYGALGFIKLPLNTVTDFFNYSLKNKADLLILSRNDLNKIPEIFTTKSFNHLLKRHALSIFIATSTSSFPSDHNHLFL